jgi:hypothetical protein
VRSQHTALLLLQQPTSVLFVLPCNLQHHGHHMREQMQQQWLHLDHCSSLWETLAPPGLLLLLLLPGSVRLRSCMQGLPHMLQSAPQRETPTAQWRIARRVQGSRAAAA